MQHGKMGVFVVSIIILALSSAPETASASGKAVKFTATDSGSFVTVPLDLDNDHCVTMSGVTLCSDLSASETRAGKTTGGGSLSGPFTHQGVDEVVAVAGSGCLIDPTGIKSCTLGTTTDACEFTSAGGSYVNRNSQGDLVFGFYSPGGSACIDFSSAPSNFSHSFSGTITGGTGKLSGVTGTFSGTRTGQIMSSDMQGHLFGWTKGAYTGTATLP
jgi:hypothetical protein